MDSSTRIKLTNALLSKVKESLIGRTPKSYFLFKDGLVVNDYSLNRPGTAITVRTPKKQRRRPRSASPTNRARNGSRSNRPRSSTHCRQSIEALNSPAHQSRPRSKSPYDRKRSESPRRVYNHHDYAHLDNGKLLFKRIVLFLEWKISRDSFD